HDTTQPIPERALQHFLDSTRNSYLSARLSGDWIVAAVKAGDYIQALQLQPGANTNSSVDCSLLLARHMTGQSVTSQDTMQAFSPNRSCWSMLDQFAESNIVGWDDLSFQLRAILETSQTGNAQRMAAILF